MANTATSQMGKTMLWFYWSFCQQYDGPSCLYDPTLSFLND